MFADFNAGHYSSRNAGFQKNAGESDAQNGHHDGDLMNYETAISPLRSIYVTFTGFLKKKGVAFDEDRDQAGFLEGKKP